jgi:hypothetical protein
MAPSTVWCTTSCPSRDLPLKQTLIILDRQKISRIKILTQYSTLGVPKKNGKLAGFITKGNKIVPCPELELSGYTQSLLKIGYMPTDVRPVHRLTAQKYGIRKTCPRKKAFDLLPGWGIFTFERVLPK